MLLYVKDTDAGEYRTASPKEIMAAASIAATRLFPRGMLIDNPRKAEALFLAKLAGFENEHFMVLFLDQRHRIIELRDMFQGTVNSSAVHVREIAKTALATNAAAIIMAHNHPSGDPAASRQDIEITKVIKQALALLDVEVLDHLIIGERCISLAEGRFI